MEFATLVLKYGLPMVTMALIVMCLVGIVKIFTKGILAKKEVSEAKKKWFAKMYLGLALVFSYVIVILYYCLILKENCWTFGCVRDAGIVWTVTSPLYQIYKQFGGRKLLLWLVVSFKGKNKDLDSTILIIEKILGEEATLLTEAQKEAIHTRLTQELSNSPKEEE